MTALASFYEKEKDKYDTTIWMWLANYNLFCLAWKTQKSSVTNKCQYLIMGWGQAKKGSLDKEYL